MISLVFIILFLFCLATAVASVLISYQFINNYEETFNKNYFYYLIAFYAFAFYGIWGQLIVRTLLTEIDTSTKVVETIANFLPILGIPFLFVSWIMLINMGYSMFSEKISKGWRYIQILLFISMIFGVWFGYSFVIGKFEASDALRKYFGVVFIVFFELLNYLAFITIVFIKSRHNHLASKKYLLLFSLLILVTFAFRSALVLFAFEGPWMLAIILFVYFFSNFIPLFYLKVNIDNIFIPIKAEHASDEKIELIYDKYKISKREKEIVQQICQGKTNQQIADELFISLQTVKDHTHRIYTKIGIKSRMQLVQLVN